MQDEMMMQQNGAQTPPNNSQPMENPVEMKIQQFTQAISPLAMFVKENPVKTGEDKELIMAIEKYLGALNNSMPSIPQQGDVSQY